MYRLAYVDAMDEFRRPVIDMTPDGAFVQKTRLTLAGILARFTAFAVLLAVGWFVFWTTLFLIPFILAAGIVGYFVLRWQMRRWR